MGKTARDIFSLMGTTRNRILPDSKTAVVVAGRTVHAGMPRVFSHAGPSLRIMAVGTGRWCPVGAVAAGTLPASVNRRSFLLLNNFKTVLSLVAVGT